MKLTVIVVLLIALTLIVSGCSPKPYSTQQVTSYLETRYDAKGRFALQEVLSEYEFLYYDNEREATFYVKTGTSGWGDNAIVPIPHRSISSYLNHGIMYAHSEQATALAKEHGLTLLPVDLLEDNSENDIISLSDFSQIDDAAALFFELSALYRLEQVDGSDGGAGFLYLPPDASTEEEEPDSRNLQERRSAAKAESTPLGGFSYRQVTEGVGYLYFEDVEQFRTKLSELWRENSLLPQLSGQELNDEYRRIAHERAK